LGAWR